jgi:hypothetical protein
MKTKRTKIIFACLNALLLYAATLFVTPLPQSATAFERVVGQDKTGKNCERIDTPGSSTFGKCESVCKDKEITRDALNNRWVCKAAKAAGAQAGAHQVPTNGQVLDAGSNPKPKPPLTAGIKGGTKAGKAKKN